MMQLQTIIEDCRASPVGMRTLNMAGNSDTKMDEKSDMIGVMDEVSSLMTEGVKLLRKLDGKVAREIIEDVKKRGIQTNFGTKS